ncbi:MAG: sugar phosphate isomerase/epimerase family protein [Candidatus Promineifilaceae bacterium]
MEVLLGINTGFALNRFPAPQHWIPLVAETFGLRIVQFTADLLNPSLPAAIVADQLGQLTALMGQYGLEARHTFTSAFTRVNHLSHSDARLRDYWLDWFRRFVDISLALGAESMGSHFGILATPDLQAPAVRLERFEQTLAGWRQIAAYAAEKGLAYLTWEPMSVAREYGETLAEAGRIQQALNTDSPLPFKLCLDVDHGDVASPEPADSDPYAWIRAFGREAPIIHLKQTSADKGGHWPFVAGHNAAGRITPERLLAALEAAGVEQVTLLLELSFREREPFESRVVQDIRSSIDYWRPYVRF